jgi:hypothetical protein
MGQHNSPGHRRNRVPRCRLCQWRKDEKRRRRVKQLQALLASTAVRILLTAITWWFVLPG